MSTGDITDCILHSGARLNLRLHGVSRSIAHQQWDLSQPPLQPSRFGPASRMHTYVTSLVRMRFGEAQPAQLLTLCPCRWVDDLRQLAASFSDRLQHVEGVTESHRSKVVLFSDASLYHPD